MQLRLRLTLALAALGMVTSLGIAVSVRGALVAEERSRFEERSASAINDVRHAIESKLSEDQATLDRFCAVDPVVVRAALASRFRAEKDDSAMLRELQLRTSVAAASKSLGAALGTDDVWILDSRDGFVLAAPEASLATVGSVDAARLAIAKDHGVLWLSTDGPRGVARCLHREADGGVWVVAFRKVNHAFFATIADWVHGVRIVESHDDNRPNEEHRAIDVSSLLVKTDPKASYVLSLAISGLPLRLAIARIDQVILLATLGSIIFCAALGFAVARSLVSPLVALAGEARKVAQGTAAPVPVQGRDEVGQLATAFNSMLEGLEATRRQLHAVERVAAWREAARRIAHEIKNPLAPIRASIETLRRLRERNDPAFDSYFDEATRTVLQEVQRVTGIVDEFSRYARIAPPRPARVEPIEIARHVVGLFGAETADQKTSDGKPRMALATSPCGQLLADREQIIQVLVNLVKNALEATRGTDEKSAGHVVVEVEPAGSEAVRFVVRDDGPGVDPSVVPRLFEPYATKKHGGTGLGLAIAQRIAVEHGGSIAYSRGRAGGSIFRLLLPRGGPSPETEKVA